MEFFHGTSELVKEVGKDARAKNVYLAQQDFLHFVMNKSLIMKEKNGIEKEKLGLSRKKNVILYHIIQNASALSNYM